MNDYFDDDQRFLRISVFKSSITGCAGISDTLDNIYIPCDDGPIRLEDIDNMDHVFIEEQRSERYWALKPWERKKPNMAGPMAGGNLAYCSDSRCKHVYHIHDRFETWAQYESMSR